MRLQHEQAGRENLDEPRYDTETLKKVTALAQELQHRHQQTFTAGEMEEIGAEVGLNRGFIRRALEQCACGESAGESRLAPIKEQAARAQEGMRGLLAGYRRKSLQAKEALAKAWWSAGWALPLIGALSGLILWGEGRGPGEETGVPLGLFLGLGIYIGAGTFLSEEAQGQTGSGVVAKAWWAGGWTIPFVLMFLANALGFSEPAMPAAFLAGWAAYFGAGTLLSHGSEEETREQSPPVSRAALLEALFQLQAALESQYVRRAFLSIDVVDSSAMKLGASPLAVEHSFGQLHRWVGETVRAHGGELQSAAGDGMMCVFPDEAAALRAARAVQEGIDAFNRDQNRLGTPFRLRCGVSAGEVAIEPGAPLGSVQSAVIDRAAALQKRAEPGGIVVGGEAFSAAQSELQSLALLPDRIAGEPAFSWHPPAALRDAGQR